MNVEPWMGVIGILITVAGSYGAARYAGKSSVKVKELDVDGQAYIRAQGINTEIVEALRQQIKDIEEDRKSDKAEYQEQLAKRDVRLDAVEREVREVRTHNNALIAYCYRLIEILRRHGHGHEIPTPPPPGIHL
ncbi:hypothetical protein QEO74_gp46 [Arthrobacter phage Nandita]|uniref:Uncharacterized protein n=1 Tax=Arthrobacter phage Nandita TaxID=2419963 RepID=A0A3G2KI31_9CAUD|nr:hypothetical protein QEO74_gp46 [Arthrobacter phage Nandita]AYN58645.1 hypothetical protein PBI_NANDITA_24 [Arthrobacter phage Nandita]